MVDFHKDYVIKMFSIGGRTVIVTGATGALGGTTVAAYAACGAEVMFTGRNKEKLEALAGKIHDAGGGVLFYAADPPVEGQVKGLVAFAAKQYDGLDILAVSHGYNKPQNILDQLAEDQQYIMDADLKSVYMTVKYAGEWMARQEWGGKMVVVSSARFKMGMAGHTGYCASKGTCDLTIQSLTCDLPAKYNINVNTINPTVSRSEFAEWMFDTESEVYRNFLKRLPIGQLGESSDLVGMAVFLVASASDFLIGGNYDATGGYWTC